MTKFTPGTHAATYIRTGWFSFAVYPRGFAGSHVLELVDFRDSSGEEIFVTYLDGVPVEGPPVLWDLATELSVGESRFVDDEDA